jgi:hypothetical protein
VVADPDDLRRALNPTKAESKYDAFIDGIRDDPNTYEDESRAYEELEVQTPNSARNGSVWAPQSTQTSTTNPERPRTRTAGYDRKNFILTVQFRDGTVWNYYDVNPRLWDDFRDSASKHEFIENGPLSGWPDGSMGPAAISAKQSAAYKGLAKIAERTQRKTYISGYNSKNSPFGGKL